MAMNMAATLFHMTVDECLAGVTINAAKALGLSHEIGTLEAGKACDLAIWNCEHPADLVYFMGFSPLHSRVFQGQTV
jgi:imidazolonepropionase